MAINYKRCPKCGSRKALHIMYGMPTHEYMVKAVEGKIKLGGCITCGDNTTNYYCTECEYEWSRKAFKEDAYQNISYIKTSIGGFWGGSTEIEIDFNSRHLKWERFDMSERKTFEKKIRLKTKEALIEDLKALNILDWKAKYDEGICDGTSWSLEIGLYGKTIKKYGIQVFPKEFDDFCRLMSRISGRPF